MSFLEDFKIQNMRMRSSFFVSPFKSTKMSHLTLNKLMKISFLNFAPLNEINMNYKAPNRKI